MRRAVGSRELKTRLGTYLREVQGGATIVVTERGRPVAELRPVQPADSLEGRLNQMAAKGLLSRGTGRPLRPFEPIKISGPPISQTIIEDREDRF